MANVRTEGGAMDFEWIVEDQIWVNIIDAGTIVVCDTDPRDCGYNGATGYRANDGTEIFARTVTVELRDQELLIDGLRYETESFMAFVGLFDFIDGLERGEWIEVDD
jgi:hypothetical protein